MLPGVTSLETVRVKLMFYFGYILRLPFDFQETVISAESSDSKHNGY